MRRTISNFSRWWICSLAHCIDLKMVTEWIGHVVWLQQACHLLSSTSFAVVSTTELLIDVSTHITDRWFNTQCYSIIHLSGTDKFTQNTAASAIPFCYLSTHCSSQSNRWKFQHSYPREWKAHKHWARTDWVRWGGLQSRERERRSSLSAYKWIDISIKKNKWVVILAIPVQQLMNRGR
jgi:hypothetical protein